MADDLITTGPTPSSGQSLTEPPLPPPETSSAAAHPAAGRFRAATAVLAALGVLALIFAGGVAASKTSLQETVGWSSWQPTDSGAGAPQQIADHVGPQYLGADGKQLASVVGGDLKVAGLPVHIAIRGAGGGSSVQIVKGSGVLYTLCGLGPRCSIAAGKPSTQRMLLLRREALELALFTFKYVEGTDNVVVLMPPRPGQRSVTSSNGQKLPAGNQGTALLFQRKDYEDVIASPLEATLPPKVPTVAEMESSPEAATVEKLTETAMYMVSIVEGQDATAYLVLDPLA